MNTNVSKIYYDKITYLADKFARSIVDAKRESNYSKVIYKAAYKAYYEIAIFLYVRLNKISYNKTKFNFNRINSLFFRKFSCRYYKKILLDLENNEVIKINNHYSNASGSEFSKAFLIHKTMINKIDESKSRFKYEIISIEVPEKILKIFKNLSLSSKDDNINYLKSLNPYYGKTSQDELYKSQFYTELNFDQNKLDKYCGEDDFLYNFIMKKLDKLKNEPKLIKNRLYHTFHFLSRKERETFLTLDGEPIKEIFDVAASDLHMLAKCIESADIPYKELINFQNDVKSDFRKLFGVRKKDGKCTARVKRAFKIYLNCKRSKYNYFRGYICRQIDKYFEEHYPTIREFIINHDNLWELTTEKEYETISCLMFKRLRGMGIKALTCHDAIYVKKSEKIDNIKDLFYQSLCLAVDQESILDSL